MKTKIIIGMAMILMLASSFTKTLKNYVLVCVNSQSNDSKLEAVTVAVVDEDNNVGRYSTGKKLRC